MFQRRVLALVVAACITPTVAGASPIVLSTGGALVLDSANLGSDGSAANPWLVSDTFNAVGVGTLAFSDVDGRPLGGGVAPFITGSWFTATITNNSGVDWTSFELELQETLGTTSGEGDGLSFAQGAGLVFTSDGFSSYTRIDTARDYLNFSGGTIRSSQSVTFKFAVSDNSPHAFYLAAAPNRVDASKTPGSITGANYGIVLAKSEGIGIAQIPEPASLILFGAGLAGLAVRRRRRS